MTRQQLSQFYYLTKLRMEAEEELDNLIRQRAPKIMPMDDMPHGKGITSSPTESLAIQITEQIEVVRGIMVNCQKKEKEIWTYISSLEESDCYLAAIVKFRCIDLLSWERVAGAVGNGSADACRKYFERNIPAK